MLLTTESFFSYLVLASSDVYSHYHSAILTVKVQEIFRDECAGGAAAECMDYLSVESRTCLRSSVKKGGQGWSRIQRTSRPVLKPHESNLTSVSCMVDQCCDSCVQSSQQEPRRSHCTLEKSLGGSDVRHLLRRVSDGLYRTAASPTASLQRLHA